MTIQESREQIRSRLQQNGIEDFEYETWMILFWKLGVDRAEYFMNPNKIVSQQKWEEVDSILKEREQHVPLQYLMGSCEFMGYSFSVDERVLIPRQDTECLVELAVEKIRKIIADKAGQQTVCKVLDLCTGSGCIGISVKLLCPEAEVTLADVSLDALAVAKQNAQSLGAEVQLVQSDLLEQIYDTYDCILSNPPYIPSAVIEGLMPEVRVYEPRLALDGREDGLFFYRKITQEAGKYLRAGGYLFFEIGQEQGEALLSIMKEQEFAETEIKKDLAGLDRIAVGRLL